MPNPANLPQTTNRSTPTSAQSLPDRLTALLASGESPVVGPDAANQLAAYAETPEPPLAAKEQVEVMIGKLAMATAQTKMSQAEASERIDLYWMALNDIPVDDLRAGFVKLVRTAKFLPTPSEIREVALKAGATRKYLKSRARFLAWKHGNEWKPETEYIGAAEIAALLPQINAA
jgi:hypothetical protein